MHEKRAIKVLAAVITYDNVTLLEINVSEIAEGKKLVYKNDHWKEKICIYIALFMTWFPKMLYSQV